MSKPLKRLLKQKKQHFDASLSISNLYLLITSKFNYLFDVCPPDERLFF